MIDEAEEMESKMLPMDGLFSVDTSERETKKRVKIAIANIQCQTIFGNPFQKAFRSTHFMAKDITFITYMSTLMTCSLSIEG